MQVVIGQALLKLGPASPSCVMSTTHEPTTGPITLTERIVSIDVLRGFVVLGILVMNIQSYSMIGMAYVNPTAYGDLTGANYLVWLLSHIFADQKFMAIFSMLFGAGIIVMTGRRESDGLKERTLRPGLERAQRLGQC